MEYREQKPMMKTETHLWGEADRNSSQTMESVDEH